MNFNPKYDIIFDAEYWQKYGAPHEVIAKIREESPVLWYEHEIFDPVWLVTRHKDVEFVGKNSNLFLSSPRTVIHNPKGYVSPLVGLPQLDGSEHTDHRKAIAGWFTAKAIKKLEDRINEIAKILVDKMATKNACEFCDDIAAKLPLKMMCELLGIPQQQEATVLKLARDVFAAADPALAGAKNAKDGVKRAMEFCVELAIARQKNPTDDLASTIANTQVNGELLTIPQIASHLLIMISAGHDTTASAISGGMLALIRNPDQMVKLKENPELTDLAINEMLRYVTPTTSFVRTAKQNTEIGGVKISKGDDICIHFSAANRDPAEFENPDAFIIDRKPNRHLVFGKGPHVCIGLLLAKLEMIALYKELIPRLKSVELTEKPKYVKSFWVTGLKRLSLRYDMA